MRTSLLLVAIAATIYLVATPATSISDDGWSPIEDISNPGIQEIGGWAVEEHVKQTNDSLKFSRVVSGEMQISRANFRLIIDASNNDGNSVEYEALVYQMDWGLRRLLSFRRAN
ncbi:hypothetical protein ACP70R_016684 [Stipagrostis hirtigluma subsp. patula]